MNETVVTLVGHVATQIDYRETPNGPAARFRFAVRPRFYDRQKEAWTDGATSFYTVWARRSLAANLAASVSVGEPLVLHGRLRVRDEQGEGQRWVSAEIDVLAAGHDLSRGTAAFRRVATVGAPLTEAQKGSVV
ncbi:single-stranded DNA-binding protein [Streptomyces sp. WAC06614]|uniref:single-stranded DNA-binding protein n=1 Tax=Streptomyces sp. WAC06614 TaxID=2487416 RepID=UPI000F794373|nr:single-stranded DNA-binding protein [Streptomyces sp. WAC06614]RSS56289.1 single-stranded DNA-binding protein [Streptomyces sp. WAC06614]